MRLKRTILIVTYAATWATFKPKLEKYKKYPLSKIFQEMELSCSPKNLIKPFDTLNKTPLGETGCLSNLYYFLAAQAFTIDFQNCSLKNYIFENCLL